MKRTCSNCACFRWENDLGDGFDGSCRRFPQIVWKQEHNFCMEHRFVFPSEEIRNTDIDLLQTSPRTRRICKNLKLRIVDDLLIVGHNYIALSGIIDFQAVRELKFALEKIGVDW